MNIESLHDDPSRTAPPTELTPDRNARYEATYERVNDFYLTRTRDNIKEVMSGRAPSCRVLCGGVFQVMGAADLYDAIFGGEESEDMAKLAISPLDQDAKAESWVWADTLITAFIERDAEYRAERAAVLESVLGSRA